MNINTTREISVAKAERSCSWCKSKIKPKDFHLKTTTHQLNNYPIRKNWCKKCSLKYLETLKDNVESMIESITLNRHGEPKRIDPVRFGEFL
jgi:uncharacterized protein YlaI